MMAIRGSKDTMDGRNGTKRECEEPKKDRRSPRAREKKV
jgi:hypothetical protein